MMLTGRAILTAHISLAATFLPLAVRLTGLKTLLRLIDPPRWLRMYRHVSPEDIRNIVQARLARPRIMRRRACLRESLLMFHFLSLSGQHPTLHMAVFPSGSNRSHGHCWVSLHGQAFTQPPAEPAAEVLAFTHMASLKPVN